MIFKINNTEIKPDDDSWKGKYPKFEIIMGDFKTSYDKGSLVNTKLLGKRQLAYPINNMNYANYVHLDVELNTDTLQLLEEKFKFDQNVFRHLTVKVEQ